MNVRHILATLGLVCLLTVGLRADEPQLEFWPEVQLWLRMSQDWRLALFVPITKDLETNYREGQLVLQSDLAWGRQRPLRRRLLDENRALHMRPFLARGGFLIGRSLDDHGAAYRERTLFSEMHVRTPIKGGLLMQQRLRNDVRWLGDTADVSTRWRYRIHAETEATKGRASIVSYVNSEAYYDSRYDTVNRIRVVPGTSMSWSPRWAVETNLTYQYDRKSSTRHLLALNVVLHVFFESRRARAAAPAAPDARMGAADGDLLAPGWPSSGTVSRVPK